MDSSVGGDTNGKPGDGGTTDEAHEQRKKQHKRGGPQVTPEEGTEIVKLHAEGLSNRAIGEKLHRQHSTVAAIIKKWTSKKSFSRAKGSGAARLTSPQVDRYIGRAVKRNRFVTAAEIQQMLPIKICQSTTLRRIAEMTNFHSHWAARKPYISGKKSQVPSRVV